MIAPAAGYGPCHNSRPNSAGIVAKVEDEALHAPPRQILELRSFPRQQQARGGIVEAGTLQLTDRA